IHLNDNAGGKDPNKYAAFRLESETYPELTAKDGHYTKKEFREFMLYCKSIGVTVIPEIDVPAHSLAFTRVRPDFASKKYGADHLDLDKSDEILAWLKPLFAEYMTGKEPTFAGPYVHVGTDEYNKKEAEKFRAFTDAMLKMVIGFGYKPCAWGALSHASGKTPVIASRDITMDIWNNRYYHPEAALKDGYTVVTIPDKIVYLVPFGGYYNDYFNCKKIYETWDPTVQWRYKIPQKYFPQLAGGKFALWNDLCGKKKDGTPYAEADNWDRIHPALQMFSQKMWRGGEGNPTWEDFARIADSLNEPKGVKSTHKAKMSK
ncbi:MAG: family 20 glycosylhydrolase, partial [Kiritimatiellae bacterium]|nr:family 20 glycosylhydrolase [Kiritimatiellia bacterium]